MDDYSDDDPDDPMPLGTVEKPSADLVSLPSNSDVTQPEQPVCNPVKKRQLETNKDVEQKRLKCLENEPCKNTDNTAPDLDSNKNDNISKFVPISKTLEKDPAVVDISKNDTPSDVILRKVINLEPLESTDTEDAVVIETCKERRKRGVFDSDVRMVEIETLIKKNIEGEITSKSIVAINNKKSVNLLGEDTSGRAEEIVIDSDDETNPLSDEETKRQKKAAVRKSCCNFECKSGASGDALSGAPVFVLTYYGLKCMRGKRQKVCRPCFEEAVEHQEIEKGDTCQNVSCLCENCCIDDQRDLLYNDGCWHLSYILSEHKPLLTSKFPPRSDFVVIMDSDEELSDEEEPLEKEVLMEIEDKLFEVIDSTLENYDLDYQLGASKIILDTSLNSLEAGYKETDDLLNRLQKTIDSLRLDLYLDYVPPIKELPSIQIVDTEEITVPDTPVKPQAVVQQTSLQYPSPKRPLPGSPTSGSSADSPKRLAMSGVATKKVTQVARSFMSVAPPSPAPPPTPSLADLSQSQDVVALDEVQAPLMPMLPPIGPLVRPRPLVGDSVYAMRHGFYGAWARAKVLEVLPKSSDPNIGPRETAYKVKLDTRKSNPIKNMPAKHLSYVTPCPVRFPVGTRVIALFRDEWAKECYYAGVIAEPPKCMNRYRYLVFFDDGYAQYVEHDKVLLVCETSRDVWEDIHPESRDFVMNYLHQYPERPMVKLQQGQIVKTEWNGKWWIARVVEVDGSLVKMHFDADGRTELIYRGSTRLGPLFAELANAANRKTMGSFSRHRGLGIASLKKRNMPYVEYTRTDLEEVKHDESGGSVPAPSRAVAKKSTAKRPENMPEKTLDNVTIPTSVERIQPPGRVEYLQVNTKVRPRKFRPHQCGYTCITSAVYDEREMKGYNPIVIPLLCGYQRHIGRYRGKRVVLYKAPCGRRLRNMEELHRYLRVTKSKMAVDLFDFDFWVHCFAEFVLEKGFTNIKDLSYGAENVPVPCVNYVDHSMPDYVNYSTKRQPMEGVNLNTNPEYLTGCDCTDDCQDRDKCACWQLTIQGTAYGPGGAVDPTVGYIYKRLPEPVTTGIYECNSRCKCSNTCLNRVAQQALQLKLQVFKTENRGWGIRCLNDVPQGAFICIYAGRLLTEQGANEGGKNYGDEYLAELDYIEVVERLKEGYESDVVEDDDLHTDEKDEDGKKPAKGDNKEPSTKTLIPEESGVSEEEEEETELSQDARDSDEDFTPDKRQQVLSVKPIEEGSIRTRLRNRASRHGSDDSQEKDKDKEKEKDFEKEVDKESEKSSSDEKEKDIKKVLTDKKPSRAQSTDEFITLSDDDDVEEGGAGRREPSRFAAVSEPKKEEYESHPKQRSVREYFGAEENCYIMDAKNNGNIGRYLNHSCSPNVFVQNVFVDTHDLRFPWVAFFALTYIRSGTELTWDYNYDVGSVAGKVMHCYCGSTECRGRLL